MMQPALIIGLPEPGPHLDGVRSLGLTVHCHGDGSNAEPWGLIVIDSAADALGELRAAMASSSTPPPLLVVRANEDAIAYLHALDLPYEVVSARLTDTECARALSRQHYLAMSMAERGTIAAALDDLAAGEPDGIRILRDSLIETTVGDLVEFELALGSQDWARCGALAHRIKGAMRMIGCHSMVALSARLETHAQARNGEAIVDLAGIYLPTIRAIHAVLVGMTP